MLISLSRLSDVERFLVFLPDFLVVFLISMVRFSFAVLFERLLLEEAAPSSWITGYALLRRLCLKPSCSRSQEALRKKPCWQSCAPEPDGGCDVAGRSYSNGAGRLPHGTLRGRAACQARISFSRQ